MGEPTPRPHPGHGPAHRWGRAEALAALERPERRALLDPEAMWREVGLRSGARVAEVGAGTGYFALPAARRVGPTGRVFAIDVSPDMVELLRERRTAERLDWLEPVLSTPGRIPVPTGSVEIVLMATVLHDVPSTTVREAVRLLSPGGTFVNVDWSPGESPFGPPLEIRLTPDAAAARLVAAGLEPLRSFDPGRYHYGQLFRRTVAGGRDAPTADLSS